MLTLSDECLGISPHVLLAQRDHVRLEWRKPNGVLGRAQPESWTCGCRATIYELRVGAGQGFIRRTIRRDGDHQIDDTRPWRITEARAVWSALLAGRAR